MILTVEIDHYFSPLFLPDGTRLWPGHEPHQPSGPDPTGQEGEGARVPATL